MAMQNTRRLYLDNIRWITVLLVMIYHVFYIYNASGVSGGTGGFAEKQYQDTFLLFVYPWFMVLLFVVSGMSARFSLETRTCREFFRSRTVKLLVPSTIGLFVFQWITGLLNMYVSGAFDQGIPGFVIPFVAVLSGIGPLWFAQMVWILAILTVIVRKIDRHDVIYRFFGHKVLRIILIIGGMFIMWGSSQILNTPVITVYRFGIYGAAYFLGYYLFAHDEVTDLLAKISIPLTVAGVITGIVYAALHFGMDYTQNSVLHSPFTNAYLWLMVLAVLGFFKRFFDVKPENKIAAYFCKHNFGMYVTHYAPTVAGCILLKEIIKVPSPAAYTGAILISFAGTVIIYEILRRIPLIRWCVYGIRGKKKNRGDK